MKGSSERLSCERCGKCYDKAASLKRHGYYCKSRPLGPPKSKKRCCEACSKRKIRCDGLLPACFSCTSRGIACNYGEHALANLAQEGITPEYDALQANNFDTIRPIEAEQDMPCPSAGANPSSMIAIATKSPVLAPATFDFAFADMDFFEIPSTEVTSPSTSAMPMLSQGSPRSLQWKAPKVMYQRQAQGLEAQMSMTMLTEIIRSLPHMMLQKETFPPFIHGLHYDCGPNSEVLPDILKDCMGLAQMFVARTPETSKFVWRAIRMEQEKLLAQYESFSNVGLQAAVQAMIIYTSMRLVDGDPEHDSIEIPLLNALQMISNFLSIRLGGDEYKGALVQYKNLRWHQWVFYESRRRVVCIARIMNMVFSLDQAVCCQPLEGFSLIPLPAGKTLWGATEHDKWRAEFNTLLREYAIHGLTDTGKLVKLHQTDMGIQSWAVPWQDWYASQDQFGILVLLTSKLLGD